MRKICINISFIVAVLSCISCYDVLDKRPLNIYTDNDVWSNATLLDNFIASQYMYTPVMVGDATTLFNSWTGTLIHGITWLLIRFQGFLQMEVVPNIGKMHIILYVI